MSFFSEFKEFAVKGNMVDMAIGIIIGAAFKDVVDVIVKKVMLPPLSLLTDGIHFADKNILLKEARVGEDGKEIKAITVGYGELIEVFIDFIIIAFVVFLVVKVMNSLKKKAEDDTNKTVSTPKNIQLMTETNKLLREQVELLKRDKEKN